MFVQMVTINESYVSTNQQKLIGFGTLLNFFQNGRQLDQKWNLVLPEVSFFLLKLILMLDKTSPCLFSTISAWKIMHYYDYWSNGSIFF